MLKGINAERMEERMKKLEQFHEPGTSYTRRSFTAAYHKGREFLAEEMKKCNLSVRIDPAGNLIGRRNGRDPSLPTIMIGSHTDTVMNGGRYDGIAGVMAAIEIACSLNENEMMLNHPLEVVDFLAEEVSAFGAGTIGSRGMAGRLTSDILSLQDAEGRILSEMIKEAGGEPQRLNKQLLNKGDVKAFLEMHIEQGPVLEHENKDIGVVTGISGIRRYQVKVIGKQGHAGTVPLNGRKDALVAASKMAVCLREKVLEYKVNDDSLVGTVGVFNSYPNHANVIPGEVVFQFEIRGLQEITMEKVISSLITEFNETAKYEGCAVEYKELTVSQPVISDDGLVSLLRKSSEQLGYAYKNMSSGAGHDTIHMAAISPVAMVFIPCKEGLSHHPDEFTTMEQIKKGTEVLGHTILELDKLK
ncbi:allantoate amidohydrolase [Virgibacillus kimchii]